MRQRVLIFSAAAKWGIIRKRWTRRRAGQWRAVTDRQANAGNRQPETAGKIISRTYRNVIHEPSAQTARN